MKKRNGFVSNSSSSSFIVAFPQKPETVGDVFEMMFDNKDGIVPSYDEDYKVTHAEVARIVFEEIKKNNFKEAKDKEIINELTCRYIYSEKSDAEEGAWLVPINEYCGSDSIKMEELRQLTISSNNKINKIKKNMDKIIKERGPKKKGAEDIFLYDKKYLNQLDKFCKSDKEYDALDEKYHRELDDLWEKTGKLCDLIAESDKNKFIKDNENCFIFLTTYSDNGSRLYSAMEHGDIFHNIPHIVISYH